MARKKKERQTWQHKFTLSSDNDGDIQIHELLMRSENATALFREAMSIMVLRNSNHGTKTKSYALEPVSPEIYGEPLYVTLQKVEEAEKRIEAKTIDTQALPDSPSPNEIIRRRKEEAARKHGGNK